MPFVTFTKKNTARTGNILFQYLFSKVISMKYGHVFIPIEEIKECNKEGAYYINDNNASNAIQNLDSSLNIICDGFFQKDEYYIPFREQLVKELYQTDDYWIGYNGKKEYMCDFIKNNHKYKFEHNDIVISLRLDDFIQLPRETSDIIPPTHYFHILSNTKFNKLYIVCDTIRHEWERRYLDFFQKWNPVLIQEDIYHDCAVMRDCPILLHSNSTLCWFMSFISKNKLKRYIPKTGFYHSQSLGKIEWTDILLYVKPLTHHEVYNIHYHPFLKSNIYPLSYCIPDECIVNDDVLRKKNIEIAPLIPGEKSTYSYGPGQEKEYNEMYQKSLFAHTMKKGGWDCLRHYEIMANGCIPIFKDLDNCPPDILTTFPKELIKEANSKLLSWNYDNKIEYDIYVKKLLQHVREHCSASSTAEYFVKKMSHLPRIKNILLIMGDIGVNYTRETFWIGMKRYIQKKGGVAVEYPKLDFLYESFPKEKNLYGNGFTYSRRLKDDYSFSDKEIEDKIKNKFFDVVIYGKVGPDEGYEGSMNGMAHWDTVINNYTRDEIVFLYGGDECIDLRTNNRYSQHILYHSQYGHCFVRELLF